MTDGGRGVPQWPRPNRRHRISRPGTSGGGLLRTIVYSSLLIVRQNEKERFILRSLFDRLRANPRLLPPRYRARWEQADDADKIREIAYFLTSLTDRGALDFKAELFDPHGRAMGHRLA